jgi:hypothetical protein
VCCHIANRDSSDRASRFFPRGAGAAFAIHSLSSLTTPFPTTEPMRRIQLTETDTRDGFGDRIVALAGVVAVTATGMHHQAGAVYVYGPGAADGALLVSAPDALLAFVPSSLLRAPEHARGVRTNDNWGWTDPETGREYALRRQERWHVVHRHHGYESRADRRPAEGPARHGAWTSLGDPRLNDNARAMRTTPASVGSPVHPGRLASRCRSRRPSAR